MPITRWLLAVTLLVIAVTGMAVEYPSRAIPDITARMVSAELPWQMERQMGRHVIVDNRPGGNCTLGAELLVRSNADGRTRWAL